MKKIIAFASVAFLGIILSGCVLNQSKTPEPIIDVAPIEEARIINQEPAGTQSAFVDKNRAVKGPLTKLSITFNTDIDEKTLTDKTFYALAGVDEKVPGKITYDKKIKTATITFTTPVVGGISGQETRVTVNAVNILDTTGKTISPMTYSVDVVK